MTLKPNIFLKRGDTDSITATFTGEDLTGATVFFTAKPTISNVDDDTDAVMSVTVTDFSPEGNDPENGIVVIPLTSTTTDVDVVGTYTDYYYDIQVKLASGNILSIPVAKLRISQDISRRIS